MIPPTPPADPPTLRLAADPHRAVPDPVPYLALTPNPRAADALGVKRATLDDLATELLRAAGIVPAGELARRRALRAAVAAVAAPDDPGGAARTWEGAVADLLRAGLDRDLDEDALPPRATRMLAVARDYRARLAARGETDPADALWAALRTGPAPRRILLAGYPRVGPAEYALLRAVAGPGSLVVLPEDDPDAERELGDHGWRVERDAEPPTTPGGRLARRFAGREVAAGAVRAHRYPSQDTEVRAALTWVKRLLHDGVAPERIGLVARDERAYGPVVADVAWEYEIPVAPAYAQPLTETRVGGWLAALGDAVRGAPFEATARLLAHPLTGGLDAAAWARARAEHPSGVAAWRALEPRAAHLAWPVRATRAAHRARLERAVQAFGVAERTERSRDPRDALALRRFFGAAGALADPPEREISRGAFFAELGELLTLLAVPAHPRSRSRPAGVALRTPLAVYGARFDHLWILGMAEGVTPAPVRDDPALDFWERRALRDAGLPLESAAEAARREATSFAAMLRAARGGVVLSRPDELRGEARIASAYLARLGARETRAPAKLPASPEEMRRAELRGDASGPADDSTLAAARRARHVERRRESGEPHDEHDGVVGVALAPARRGFSATQLTRLGQCPYAWFAKRLLRLEEPEEAEDEISPLLRGRLWHAALEHATEAALATAPADAAALRAAILGALEPAFERAERDEGVPADPAWPRQRAEHLRQLRLAVADESFVAEDARVVATEAWFEGRWRGLAVAGVVDRIDRTSEGLRLVDYKTRGSRPDGAKDAGGRAKLDVQLPLYVETAAPALFPGEPVAGAAYWSLTHRRTLAEAEPDDAALDALVARVRGHLEAGSYPVDPDMQQKACSYCAYDPLCRRGPRLERKRRAAERRAEPRAEQREPDEGGSA